MHLKGHLSINLVVLVVTLLLGGEKFLAKKRMFSCPFSACHWRRRSSGMSDLLQSRRKEVSL
jgi:hypothetical protein